MAKSAESAKSLLLTMSNYATWKTQMQKDCYSCGKAVEEIRKDEVFILQRPIKSTHVEEDVRTYNFEVEPPTESIVQHVRE